MKRILAYLAVLAITVTAARAQTRSTSGSGATIDGKVELDKTVHDFGDVLTGSGPLTCTFTVKNISSENTVIYNVVKSCGCTDITWTREDIVPGGTGTITATYTNDEGPYPFSKNLTVYIAGLKKPVILRLRGTARSKKEPLEKVYPIHLGELGIKEMTLAGGNMTQGSQRSDSFTLANLGRKKMTVSFADISEGLEVFPQKADIAPGATASFSFTVTSSRDNWGRNNYYMTPVVNGKKASDAISVWAFIKEDFSSWDKKARDRAALPSFEASTVNLDTVDGKAVKDISFTFKNTGKSDFHIYKADSDSPALTVYEVPDVAPGKSGTLKGRLDCSKLPKGEFLIIVTLTTNTPLRPMVNLFVAGAVK